jgi:hypothetical protein
VTDTNDSVREYLKHVTPAKRRRDAGTLLALMARATGEPPELMGTMIGFGRYHYKYASGREGDAPAAGFAPRKAATTVYLMDGVGRYEEHLQRLGPHSTGVGCVYIKDLEEIDQSLLETIIVESFRTLSSGTYTLRAREGAKPAGDEAQPLNGHLGRHTCELR